jgi:hypothetical protein
VGVRANRKKAALLASGARHKYIFTSPDVEIDYREIWHYSLVMASIKATFSLDKVTLEELRRTADRLGRGKSEVVRMAIHDYSENVGRLSERERLAKLRALDELLPGIPRRPAASVDREIEQVRAARRGGGRRKRDGG